MNKRVKYQQSLLESGENIEIHDIASSPIDCNVLKNINEHHPMVERVIKGGLTAYIYQLKVGNKYYCLKKKRHEILVKNDDGQLSFLNEILCRKVLEDHRDNPIIQKGIAKTYYASLEDGFILSEWIHGDRSNGFNRQRFRTIFQLQLALEKLGLFEWDMCPGNLLFRDDQLVLFDFGYMYPTNILEGPNSDGMASTTFHAVERLETRSLVQVFLDLEVKGQSLEAKRLYRILKEEAILSYSERVDYLKKHGAKEEVIVFFDNLLRKWKGALVDEMAFEHLYLCEKARSYTLDILDDLHGKTCTKYTLAKIDAMFVMIKDHYLVLKERNALLWDDALMTKAELMDEYKKRNTKALEYQIEDKSK